MVTNKKFAVIELLDETGMGLVGFMVTAGIVATMALGSISVYVNGVRGQNRLEAMSNSSALANELKMLISNPVTCINSIGSDHPFNEEATRSTEGQNFGMSLTDNERVAQGASLGNYGLNIEKYILKDALAGGTDSSGNNMFVARVELQVSSQKEVNGSKILTQKPISLVRLGVDGSNKIVSCSPVTGSTPDCNFNLASLGGSGNGGSSGGSRDDNSHDNGNHRNSGQASNPHCNGHGRDDDRHGERCDDDNSNDHHGGGSTSNQMTLHHGETYDAGCGVYTCLLGAMVQNTSGTCTTNTQANNGHGDGRSDDHHNSDGNSNDNHNENHGHDDDNSHDHG